MISGTVVGIQKYGVFVDLHWTQNTECSGYVGLVLMLNIYQKFIFFTEKRKTTLTTAKNSETQTNAMFSINWNINRAKEVVRKRIVVTDSHLNTEKKSRNVL